MEVVDIAYAKEHLEELIARAAQGEEVRIADPRHGKVRLALAEADTTPAKRRLGLLEGKIPPPPDDFFDPLSEEELKYWYGNGA